MNVLGFNGSPRRNWNTAALLEKALEGAASRGASTRMVHLYDLRFVGCKSCFACKTKGGPSHGRCALKDDLAPVLEEVAKADAIVLGSPVYFWSVTGEMKAFLERLMFPYYRYAGDDDPVKTLFPRRIPVGFIYTLGATEERMRQTGFHHAIANNEMFLERTLGPVESMACFDTLQVEDYARLDHSRFDPGAKRTRRERQFPLDGQRAFELGRRLVP